MPSYYPWNVKKSGKCVNSGNKLDWTLNTLINDYVHSYQLFITFHEILFKYFKNWNFEFEVKENICKMFLFERFKETKFCNYLKVFIFVLVEQS